MVEQKKPWWKRFTRLERILSVITLSFTILFLFSAYRAYKFIKSDFAIILASSLSQQYERGDSLQIYKIFKPEIAKNLDSKKDFLRPFSYWLSADPEENYELLRSIGLQVLVKNEEKIPKTGKVVVIANHRTAWDTMILMHVINQARSDLSACLFADWTHLNLEEAHPSKLFLVRDKKLIPGALDKISEVLDDERPFILFPAGSIGFQHFHSGALRIALDNAAPILPIRIKCNLHWWAEIVRWLNPELLNSLLIGDSFRHYQKNVIEVIIGDPIPYEKLCEYKERMIETPDGKRYDPKIMEELRRIVDNLR